MAHHMRMPTLTYRPWPVPDLTPSIPSDPFSLVRAHVHCTPRSDGPTPVTTDKAFRRSGGPPRAVALECPDGTQPPAVCGREGVSPMYVIRITQHIAAGSGKWRRYTPDHAPTCRFGAPSPSDGPCTGTAAAASLGRKNHRPAAAVEWTQDGALVAMRLGLCPMRVGSIDREPRLSINQSINQCVVCVC